MSVTHTLEHDYLQQWIKSDRQQPPVILSSHDELKLADTLTELKLQAVCTKHQDTPCKKCGQCKLVLQSTHPDVIDIAPAKLSWQIKEVRELKDRLSRTSLTKKRIVVLRDAEKFFGPAANALLKMLEEPAASSRVVLVTMWPRQLLPTILSRCHIVRLASNQTPSPTNEAVNLITVKEHLKSGGKEPLTQSEISEITSALEYTLREQGPTPELRRAFFRLRDYHLIRSKNGNGKLASDVLLLSLPQSFGTS